MNVYVKNTVFIKTLEVSAFDAFSVGYEFREKPVEIIIELMVIIQQFMDAVADIVIKPDSIGQALQYKLHTICSLVEMEHFVTFNGIKDKH